jgi:hypothetical protein
MTDDPVISADCAMTGDLSICYVSMARSARRERDPVGG